MFRIFRVLTLKISFFQRRRCFSLRRWNSHKNTKNFSSNSKFTARSTLFRFDEKNHVFHRLYCHSCFFCSLSLSSFTTEIELSERARRWLMPVLSLGLRAVLVLSRSVSASVLHSAPLPNLWNNQPVMLNLPSAQDFCQEMIRQPIATADKEKATLQK